jgi:signal transduction histidine kinase
MENDRINSRPAAPTLLVGFGLLIGLIALTGLGALRRAGGAYRDITDLNSRYRRTERALDDIGARIYAVGLIARDYLLDPSHQQAAAYRAQLLEQKSGIEAQFREIQDAGQVADTGQIDRLRKEAEAYWETLDPLFTWTPEEKAARSWTFLRRDVLRRRDAALSIAREIHALARGNLTAQRREIDRRQADMATFIRRMLAVTVLLGVAIASATLVWTGRLERRSYEQRRRAEAAERDLRLLSRQLVQAQEQERKSISRELHDEVGQMLTALRIEIKGLQHLRGAPEAEFEEHAESAKRLAEQSLRALKDMAMGLRPSMLDDLGLGSAVQWQARQFSKRTGIPVNVRLEGLAAPLPDRHRTCVYRLVQEALTNCARHAKAKNIDVSVTRENGALAVSIQDDGQGFEPAAVRGRGLGLIGIEERVLELGGQLTIVSRPQEGAAISAQIPLDEESRDHADANSAG